MFLKKRLMEGKKHHRDTENAETHGSQGMERK
jgi:hypothetical protein